MSSLEFEAYSGERFSFFQLIKEKRVKVEIPIIQRDYAQGRQSETEVRTAFLRALFDYLNEGEPFRDLDFIYGTVAYMEGGLSRFIPLDGQQRLTTLFLLHWYLAQIAGKFAYLREVLSLDGRSLFTYETRASSREFCNALIANDIECSDLQVVTDPNSLSKTIQDRGWFRLSWRNDPTILSMLTMLDAIHSRFAGCTEFFDKLVDLEYPVITFRFLNLDKFKLSDDLYIKMNARGKPLSDFENFKARLEKTIKSFQGEWPAYHLDFKHESVTGYEYFIHKIDTDWADLFWAYRDVSTDDNTYDDELMNFIALIIANFELLSSISDNAQPLKELLGVGGKVNRRTFFDYERLGYITQELIIELIKMFDTLHKGTLTAGRLTPYLEKNHYYNEEVTFKKVLANDTSYQEKLRFYALYAGITQDKSGIELLSWMRVIFNLTENTIINTSDDYHRALRSIRDLVSYEDSVIDLLKQDIQIRGFTEVQVFEEKVKAHLLKKSPEWEAAILKLESHPFFRGQIGFALKFSGIIKYYLDHKNTLWIDTESKFYERFSYYSIAASVLFSAIEKHSGSFDYAWERAVLTKGDYLTSTSANRYNLLSTRLYKNNIERDHSWRRLLRLFLTQSDNWESKQGYVKAVLDDPQFDVENVKDGLEKICQTALESSKIDDWRVLFISEPSLFGICNQGFIVKSYSEMILLHESQRNHRHSELFSKYLEIKLRKNNLDVTPFHRMKYFSVKSGAESAYLILEGALFSNWQYDLKVCYKKNSYQFLFYNAVDSSITIPDVLLPCLRELDFIPFDDFKGSRVDDVSGYSYMNAQIYSCDTPEEALIKILEFCALLRGISHL